MKIGMGIVVLLCIAGESFLVYALVHFVCESMPDLRPVRAGTAFAKLQARQVVPLEFAVSVPNVAGRCAGWNRYIYDAPLVQGRVASARGR